MPREEQTYSRTGIQTRKDDDHDTSHSYREQRLSMLSQLASTFLFAAIQANRKFHWQNCNVGGPYGQWKCR